MDFEDFALPTCCPDADRIDGQETAEGLPVYDLHLHRGMLRGVICGRSKPTFWYRDGRLTPVQPVAHDIGESWR